MVTYGRGGAGFTLLDVTNPFKPYHIYSVLNDPAAQKVFHASENGTISEFAYTSKRASIVDFKESDNALVNKKVVRILHVTAQVQLRVIKGKNGL